MSLRRFLVLVRHLPRGSSTVRALTGSDWTTGDYLLANVFDVLAAANFQRGGGKGRKPQPLDRPGVTRPGQEKLGGSSYSIEEMRELLAARNGRR